MMMDEKIEPLMPGIMEMVFPRLVHIEELYPHDQIEFENYINE